MNYERVRSLGTLAVLAVVVLLAAQAGSSPVLAVPSALALAPASTSSSSEAVGFDSGNVDIRGQAGDSNIGIVRGGDNGGHGGERRSITITNTGSALTDHQVLVTLDTISLILAGKMQVDCDDIRLTDSDGTTRLSHWVESGCNSANTNIWVKIPSIPAMGTTIVIHYGNATEAKGSDFFGTFPNRFIVTGGVISSSGALNYHWFEVQKGATLNITSGSPQVINAHKIIIAGTVNGNSRGFPGAASIGTGEGPRGGSHKSGGGYGGAGGQGKDSGFSPGGTPGSTYGSASSQTIQMGSGGGASIDIQAPGGPGGGAVTFNSTEIVISGTVTMNGGSNSHGTNQNGGGAGGGILIVSSRVYLSGTLSVRGGAAEGGTVRAGGAGGGGGGRIKIFHDSGNLTDSSVKDVNGGPGSPGGTARGSFNPGEDGAAGTTHTGILSFSSPTVTVGKP